MAEKNPTAPAKCRKWTTSASANRAAKTSPHPRWPPKELSLPSPAHSIRRSNIAHLDYESLEPWPLKWIETPDEPLSYRVEKMKLCKDKATLMVNKFLTLTGIPAKVSNYRPGNRSALEWVVDQHQVSEDKRSGIKSDPNREDDEEYIVRLVGQVVRVSVETVEIVDALPKNRRLKRRRRP